MPGGFIEQRETMMQSTLRGSRKTALAVAHEALLRPGAAPRSSTIPTAANAAA